MDMQLNADRREPVLVHGTDLPWIPSPQAGVDRRMLERSGGEVAVASTIVRYGPGSAFPPHPHALGEEFVVLEGVFSDEHGDYPPGTYVRNPPGSTHSPGSRDGCTIFVKLRQMSPDDTDSVTLRPDDQKWESIDAFRRIAVLHRGREGTVRFERLAPGYRDPWPPQPAGEEIFVLEGHVDLNGSRDAGLHRWSWLRHRRERPMIVSSAGGAWLWVKSEHLIDHEIR